MRLTQIYFAGYTDFAPGNPSMNPERTDFRRGLWFRGYCHALREWNHNKKKKG